MVCSGQSIGNGIVANSDVQELSLVANRMPNCMSIDRGAKRLTPLLPSTTRPTMTPGSTFFGEVLARADVFDFASLESLDSLTSFAVSVMATTARLES